MIRQAWIDSGNAVAVVQQCALAGVSRATVYARRHPKLMNEIDLLLSGLIDAEYTRHPFYGSRRMVVFLGKAGHNVNRKRVQRQMLESQQSLQLLLRRARRGEAGGAGAVADRRGRGDPLSCRGSRMLPGRRRAPGGLHALHPARGRSRRGARLPGRAPEARLICPLQSGPSTILVWTLKEKTNGQETRA